MALAVGNEILASDFVALKARIKAECARRQYNGSVASYAGTDYDYTVLPADGNVPLPEHFNKIIEPLNAIIDTGRQKTRGGYLVRALNDIDSELTTLEAIPVDAASSGCKASCTGLCQGTCSAGCKNTCAGECKGTCEGSCVAVCAESCRYGCEGGCLDSCTGSCSGGCGDSCTGGCGDSCLDTCKNGCTGSCKRECANSCATTCFADCTNGCQDSCYGGCKSACKGTCKGQSGLS